MLQHSSSSATRIDSPVAVTSRRVCPRVLEGLAAAMSIVHSILAHGRPSKRPQSNPPKPQLEPVSGPYYYCRWHDAQVGLPH